MSVAATLPAGSEDLWLGLGLLGQVLFGARFLVQWIYSEIRGRSRVPRTFWYLSVAGGAILLVYAIHRNEIPFIAGEAVTLLVFLRNVQLLRKPHP